MFDIGFWEIIIIAVVALLIVGPDRLPQLARETGKWIGKIRRMIYGLKEEFAKELRIDEENSLNKELNKLDNLMKNAPDQDPDFKPVSATETKSDETSSDKEPTL